MKKNDNPGYDVVGQMIKIMQYCIALMYCFEIKKSVHFSVAGLTCTEQNFVTKAGAQQFAAKHGIAIVAPDTSPSK